MTYDEITKLAVFSSGTDWRTEEVRLIRKASSVVEIVLCGVGENEGRDLTLRTVAPVPMAVACELFHGFDVFHVIDLVKKDPHREVGRFEMHIFRDDDRFRFAFDSYEVEETEVNQRPDGTPVKSPPSNPDQVSGVPHP